MSGPTTTTTLLPFQPASMSNAQLAAVSYLARYSGHTHGPYPRLLDTGCDYAAVGSVVDWRAS
jgi:hypothetical protein